MTMGRKRIIGDALFFSVSQGDVYFLVKPLSSKQDLNVQILFQPYKSLIKGVIETFSLCESRLSDSPIDVLQKFLFERTKAKVFNGKSKLCPNSLVTSWGNFRLFQLDEDAQEEVISLNHLRRYLRIEGLSEHRKILFSRVNQSKAK